MKREILNATIASLLGHSEANPGGIPGVWGECPLCGKSQVVSGRTHCADMECLAPLGLEPGADAPGVEGNAWLVQLGKVLVAIREDDMEVALLEGERLYLALAFFIEASEDEE